MSIIESLFWISLAIVFYTYAGYPFLLFCLHFFVRREPSRLDNAYCPSISIILAAYNEEAHIRRKLENCLALDYPRNQVEILVGSDGSDDGTNDIVSELQGKGVKLFAFHPRQGKMATVNRLVKNARGDICVFSDISEVFDHTALHQLVRHFADPEIGAVTGNHIYNKQATGLGKGTAFYWKFQRFLQKVESRIGTIFACDGTIYACRRELFPFPPDNTINDDVAVPLGVILQGKRVIFEPDAIARGDVLSETKRFLHQKIRGQAGKYQNFALAPQMFFPWPLHCWWIFLSHSVLPVLLPWFLAFATILNIALWFTDDWKYQMLLIGQLFFYFLAAVGFLAERVHWRLPFVSIPFYFVTANVGSILGFFAFITRKQQTTWRKVE